MILPQSQAFKTLRERLSTVSAFTNNRPQKQDAPIIRRSALDIEKLAQHVESVMSKHSSVERYGNFFMHK